MNRRAFLRTGALATGAIAAGLGVDAFLIEPQHVELVRRPMPLEHLPPSLEGRTLLHVSDIHVGPDVSSRYLIDSFTRAARLGPDFVVCSGDFVSAASAQEHVELARVLRSFPRGRLGTFASLGNHDYGRAWSHVEVADQVSRVAGDAGIRVLRNEIVTVAGLQVAGLADFWSPEFGRPRGTRNPGLTSRTRFVMADPVGDARPTIAAIAPRRPTVILSHNPDVQDEPLWDGVRGWVLAGHTHGGQVKPPFLPPPVLPVRNRRYTAGVFDVGPGRTLYINRGLGNLHHVRFNVRPELTLFTLVRG